MTTFDRYLLQRFLHAFVIMFLSMYGLYMVIDGFTNVDGFQEGRESAMDVLSAMVLFYTYSAFNILNLVGPILSVLSVMIVFAMLLKNSEFHPLLAAGVPTLRLLLPVLAGVFMVSLFLFLNQELIIPRIASELMKPRGNKVSRTEHVEPVYDRNTLIHIRGEGLVLSGQKVKGAEFMLPAPVIADELTRLKADEATYYRKTEKYPAGWRLRNAVPAYEALNLTTRGKQVVKRLENPNDLFVVSEIGFEQLFNRSKNYQYASIADLVRQIRNPTVGDASLRGQIMHLHSRLTQPLLNVAVVLVAVPLILRRESRSLVTNMALCTTALGILMGISYIFNVLGQVNLIAPDLASWLPVIVSGSCGVWLMGSVQT